MRFSGNGAQYMYQEDYIIIIPTFVEYIDIVNNFVVLLDKNWPSCPFRTVIAVSGKNYTHISTNKEQLYVGDVTLPDAIRIVSNKYNSRYYICFLGDAFIYKKIDTYNVERFLSNLLNHDIIVNVKNNFTFHHSTT